MTVCYSAFHHTDCVFLETEQGYIHSDQVFIAASASIKGELKYERKMPFITVFNLF